VQCRRFDFDPGPEFRGGIPGRIRRGRDRSEGNSRRRGGGGARVSRASRRHGSRRRKPLGLVALLVEDVYARQGINWQRGVVWWWLRRWRWKEASFFLCPQLRPQPPTRSLCLSLAAVRCKIVGSCGPGPLTVWLPRWFVQECGAHRAHFPFLYPRTVPCAAVSIFLFWRIRITRGKFWSMDGNAMQLARPMCYGWADNARWSWFLSVFGQSRHP
jgi:hypothetical protein